MEIEPPSHFHIENISPENILLEISKLSQDALVYWDRDIANTPISKAKSFAIYHGALGQSSMRIYIAHSTEAAEYEGLRCVAAFFSKEKAWKLFIGHDVWYQMMAYKCPN